MTLRMADLFKSLFGKTLTYLPVMDELSQGIDRQLLASGLINGLFCQIECSRDSVAIPHCFGQYYLHNSLV
jgi:hypothetical protein